MREGGRGDACIYVCTKEVKCEEVDTIKKLVGLPPIQCPFVLTLMLFLFFRSYGTYAHTSTLHPVIHVHNMLAAPGRVFACLIPAHQFSFPTPARTHPHPPTHAHAHPQMQGDTDQNF